MWFGRERNGRRGRFSPGAGAPPLIARIRRPTDSRQPPYDWLAAGVVLLALGVRLYRLADIPTGISGDELFNAIDAWRVGKEHWPLFFEGNNGREALFLYLMAASMRLFGQTIFAIRLPAALLGAGSAWLAYLIGKDHFNPRVGLLAAGLTAVSLWPVMEARWALRAVSLTFFTALTLFWLWRGFQHRQLRDWLLGGAALGLTLYTYIPARAFPLVVLLWWGWIFWSRREEAARQWPQMALSAFTALLVFAPFGWYMWQFPEKVNQRIGTLSVALDVALKEGSLAPLGPSVMGVLRMFSFAGDVEWRYHVSGKPLFDPLTSLFFYAGVLFAVWLAFSARAGAEKRPSYALLLLWLGGMLGPNAILEANSSFLRAAGAIVPIYLLTAVGFDLLTTVIASRWRWLRRWHIFNAVAVLGLIAIGVDTWNSYVNVWNTQSDVRRIYQADMAMIGRFLNEQPPPRDVRVFLADSFVADLAPQTFAYYSDFPVDWFDAGSSFVINPAQAVWVFQAVNEPLPDSLIAQLDLDVHAETIPFENGDPAFNLYRLTSADLVWTPSQSLQADFASGPRLIGYDAPAEIFRGETIPLFVHWLAPPDRVGLPNQLTFLETTLLDSRGNAWSSSRNLLGYPQASWRRNDQFVQVVDLEIPQGMPPGEARLRFSLQDRDGNPYDIEGVTETAVPPNETASFVVRGRPLQDFTPAPQMLVFDDTVALTGSAFSSLLTPGLAIDMALDWVALQTPDADYQVQLALTAPGAAQPFWTQTFAIWPDVYPPTAWQPGEPVRTLHRLQTPLEMPTDANPLLTVQLLDADGETPLPVTQGATTLAEMTLNLRAHQFEAPPIAQPLAAQFGEHIRLLGYDLSDGPYRPGESLQLTLIWQAIETPQENWTVFNHVLDATGQLQGQFDSPPVGEAWLTASWLPGEVVVETRDVPIWETAENGRYTLAVGLYRPSDGMRLPVTVDGVPQPNDQLILTEITVGN